MINFRLTFGQGNLMGDGNRLERACAALERGCSLELYYSGSTRVVEVHAGGLDGEDRAVILAFDARGPAEAQPGDWPLLPLDEARKIAVSGCFSEAPRPGYRRDDPRLKAIIAQL
jgi:hypothetical protein